MPRYEGRWLFLKGGHPWDGAWSLPLTVEAKTKREAHEYIQRKGLKALGLDESFLPQIVTTDLQERPLERRRL